jgi:pimeloyl-ACP methyl ester carboxylesterase
MTFIWILAVLIIFSGFFAFLIIRLYRVPKSPYQITPEKSGIPFKEIKFPTKNDCHLYGWWMPYQNESSLPVPTLILVHGWGRNAGYILPYIKKLYPFGYNLLAFDLRSHGNSDSDKHPNMLQFSEDIRAAIEFILEQDTAKPGEIGVIGLSVGGSAAIHAAAFDNRIKSVITIGAFANPVDIMKYQFQEKHIPFFPLMWLPMKYFQFKMGAKFEQIAPVNIIKNTKANIFLIHGSDDKIVPVEHGKKLKNAANPETTKLWVVPGKGHSNCSNHPEFWSKVNSFIHSTMSLYH